MRRFIPANSREWIFLATGLVVSALIFSGNSPQSVPETISSQDLNTEVSEVEKVEPADEVEESALPEIEPFAVEISGPGAGQSEPFPLNRGNYRISYQTFRDCVYYADLEPVSGEGFSESIFRADVALVGTNTLYNIEQDLYYISVITGPSCAWEVEFAQF